MIKVAVFGAKGHMGQQICQAVSKADDLELVAGLDVNEDRGLAAEADVAVDFTHPDAVMGNIEWCLANNIHVVVGTTGFNEDKYSQVKQWLENSKANALIASNFSIAAILMMEFAAKAAPFFESVEIIELHHPHKVDAPSGTAQSSALKIAQARAKAGSAPMPDATTKDPGGARGAVIEGIHIHSVRSQGLFANQEVIFGNPGEQLKIIDNSFDRSSYMPGVLAGIRAVGQRKGLTIGIENLLGIA